jgi:predicted nucleic acid-binding protein
VGAPLIRLLIDASAAAAWILPGQRTAASEALLESSANDHFAAPYLFPIEIRNTVLWLEVRKRLTSIEADRAMAAIADFGISIEPPPSPLENDVIFHLARREQLTVYDALYLWQATEGGFTLASRDGALLAAASRNGVPIEDLRA